MKPVVVLGAGVAGLAAARRLRELGRDVVVVEASGRVGGLAGGVEIGGAVYEYGPHVFHTTDKAILDDVKALMGGDLLPYERTIRIKFLGEYFKFPLSMSDVLLKLSPLTVVHAAFSFAWHFTKGLFLRPEVETSETVLRRYYGDVLYRIFFRDYITRVWGIPPAEFSPAFARERIPRLDLLDLPAKAFAALRKLAARAPAKVEGYVEKVEGDLWTTKRGFSLICERMAEDLRKKGGAVRLGTKATAIVREGTTVTAVETSAGRVECSALVNTLALGDACAMVTPPLDSAAARRLKYRAIAFVGLKVRRPKVLGASFMYFREHSFNRLTDLSHFSFELEPGTTLLIAEITCSPEDAFWTDDAAATEAAIADLVREEIVARAEIAEAHVYRARHGYPVYALGYEKDLAAALASFEALGNARTAGRQGRFQYVNTHVAMRMGRAAAESLAGSPA